ncbi:MAG TPA: PrsW family glutamic-type intramembrane protease [Spirochaetota bacterium]|jgi:RsiW-degrading membrane proteinase PrsW (M82 family)|nr:PrsW family intramembrane metalloprotease [Spirochaetota bacterium]OQA98253.1 MAG: Protease PrsW [Spirochaetes bacterium ADurb.Bin218]HOK02205.1 PrsW family glutamic-type intramembrane protease [Spirochaetota bacterium]HOK92247.1 PrsW family glutamic-type intramembrane protease [Spirochaetota bacterium]HON14960.1 PrsW family glutamic-type intramembrane protease [Spirochaetota bacterium]
MLPVYLAVALSAALWLYVIYRNDKFEPEPVRTLIRVAIQGAIFSGLPSAFFNSAAAIALNVTDKIYSTNPPGSVSDMLSFALFVGFNEEFFKAMAAIYILRKLDDFNEPVDAIIYSMTVALGFAAFENIEYTVAGGVELLLVRSFTAVPLHLGLASIWGTGIAMAKYYRKGGYFLNVLPYIIPAALLHAAYNFYLFLNPGNPFSTLIAVLFAFATINFASRRLRYFLNKSPFKNARICPLCLTKNNFFDKYCKNCGSYLVSDFLNTCPNCGTKNKAGASFCRKCGETCESCGFNQ